MERAELIEKWLEALESGKYRQTQGSLSCSYGLQSQAFCCLGVAAVVAKDGGIRVSDDDIQNYAVLADSLAKKYGIDNSGSFKTPIEYRGKKYMSLVDLNDEGVRFKTIARIIREQLSANNFAKL